MNIQNNMIQVKIFLIIITTSIVINIASIATAYAFLSRDPPFNMLMLGMTTTMFSLVMAIVAALLLKNMYDEALNPCKETEDNLNENTQPE